MIIYIITLFISLFFCFIASKINNKSLRRIFSILSCLPFAIISSIRYNVGTDYLYRYVPSFEYIKNGIDISNLEIGYKLLNKLILIFSENFIWIFVITSCFIIFLIFNSIYKNSKNPMLSISIFFLGGYFFQSLNMIRQYMAFAIIINNYYLIFEKKYLKFSLSVFISSLFHSSAWIYLILIFLNKKEVLTFKIVLFFSIIIIIFKKLLLSFFIKILSFSKFSVYFDTSFNISKLRLTLLVSNIFIYLVMYYLYRKKVLNSVSTNEDTFFMNIQAIGLLFCVSGIITYLSFRIAILFFAFQILSISNLLNNFHKNLKRNITLLLIFMLILCIHHTNIKNNDEGVLPYQTIFKLP